MATRATKHLNRVASAGVTSGELLSLIQSELNKDVDTVPPGFLTSAQYAREWRMSVRRAQELLKAAAERGVVERMDFRVLSGNRRVVFPHYRPFKKS